MFGIKLGPMDHALFLNGTVGVGKSTTAEAVSVLLEERGTPHCVVDLDYIRRCWPAPLGDRFNHELELANLAALARNYDAAGARIAVLAGVIEDPEEVARYEAALGAPLTVIRLTATEASLSHRLHSRHPSGPDLDWHLRRAPELSGVLEQHPWTCLDVTDLTPEQAAESVLARLQ